MIVRTSRYLSFDERKVIERMHKKKATQKEIAEVLGVSQQTISKELKKGRYIHTGKFKDYPAYSAEKGQAIVDAGNRNKGAACRLYAMESYYVDYLIYLIKIKKFSPYAALRAVSAHLGFRPFCLNSLYNYINLGLLEGVGAMDLPEKVRRKRRKKAVDNSRKRKAAGRSIEVRPPAVAARSEFGHWEGDCVIGRQSGTGETLLTLTERVTRFELIFKLEHKDTASVCKALNQISRCCDFKALFKSITFDNGTEFSACKRMEFYRGKRRTDVYYAHPYSSWERGTNERHNRIIRRWWPKGRSLAGVQQSDCVRVARWMNDYPRRILGGLSPREALAQHVPLSVFDDLLAV